MKIKCDICSGDLIMRKDGSGALCNKCGMSYPLELLKKMYSGENNHEKQEEKFHLVFTASSRINTPENRKGFGEIQFIEYNLYSNKKLEIYHEFDEGKNIPEKISDQCDIRENDTLFLTDDEFSKISALISKREGGADVTIFPVIWRFEEFTSEGNTVYSTEGEIAENESLKAIWAFFTEKDEKLSMFISAYEAADEFIKNNYKRTFEHLNTDENINYGFIIDLYTDILEAIGKEGNQDETV